MEPPGVGVEAGQKLAPLDGSLQGPPRFAVGLIQSSHRGFVHSLSRAGALQELLSSSPSSAYVGEGSVSIASSGPFPSRSVHPTSPSSFLAFPGPIGGSVVFLLVAESPPSPGTCLCPL